MLIFGEKEKRFEVRNVGRMVCVCVSDTTLCLLDGAIQAHRYALQKYHLVMSALGCQVPFSLLPLTFYFTQQSRNDFFFNIIFFKVIIFFPNKFIFDMDFDVASQRSQMRRNLPQRGFKKHESME